MGLLSFNKMQNLFRHYQFDVNECLDQCFIQQTISFRYCSKFKYDLPNQKVIFVFLAGKAGPGIIWLP